MPSLSSISSTCQSGVPAYYQHKRKSQLSVLKTNPLKITHFNKKVKSPQNMTINREQIAEFQQIIEEMGYSVSFNTLNSFVNPSSSQHILTKMLTRQQKRQLIKTKSLIVIGNFEC